MPILITVWKPNEKLEILKTQMNRYAQQQQ